MTHNFMRTPKLIRKIGGAGLALAAGLGIVAQPARADLLELTNGDHYRGIVISMTLSNLEFQSEIQGRVKLPRDKVAKITFREPVVAKTTAVSAPVTAAPLILSGPGAAPAPTGDAVVNQMRQQGIDPKIVSQVQEQIFGKASPEAAQKFNETMTGLMSGQISVQDIRKQAQTAIGQIKSARKDLGDDAGDMLDGYLSILEKFVQETDTPGGNSAVAPPAPAAPTATK
jgi:hypothetical protein